MHEATHGHALSDAELATVHGGRYRGFRGPRVDNRNYGLSNLVLTGSGNVVINGDGNVVAGRDVNLLGGT